MYIRENDIQTLLEVSALIEAQFDGLDEDKVAYWNDFGSRFEDFRKRAIVSNDKSQFKSMVQSRVNRIMKSQTK